MTTGVTLWRFQVSEPVKAVRQERRVRTEAKLLEAFETVLIREGAGDVTVQAVAAEAQVAKTLIYRYFDGIGGLIKAWASQRDIFVPLGELFPDPEASAKDLFDDPFLFAKNQILKQAEHMHTHPAYIELCLAELSGSGPVIDALMELRVERNAADELKRLGSRCLRFGPFRGFVLSLGDQNRDTRYGDIESILQVAVYAINLPFLR